MAVVKKCFLGRYTVFACLDVSVGHTASDFRVTLLIQMYAEVIWKKKCVSYEEAVRQIGQSELRRGSVQVLYPLSLLFLAATEQIPSKPSYKINTFSSTS
jgi:hypothetical protein